MPPNIYTLAIGLFVKHFLADVVLQKVTSDFLDKDKYLLWSWTGFIHALAHTIGTLMALIIAGGYDFAWLAFADGVLHYIIDHIKSKYFYNHPYHYTKTHKAYWIAYGIDQTLHALTYLGIIYIASH